MGDRNTRYFHLLASARHRAKTITRIVHLDAEISVQAHITQIFLSHFIELLGTSRPTQSLDIQTLYQEHIDLQHLDAPFTAQEVQRAVQQLPPNKASGPDGLPNEFIQHQWHVLEPHLMKIFNGFFHHQIDLSMINQARIVLLPKTDTPLYVTDYRPISVINLIPKIISKVLANRIKPHLPQLVDEHQTAFIQGRLISENFIATREILHHVSRAHSPAVLLKLDFAKAFDTLEWNFLIQVLTARGFPHKLISWISHLLSTATSKIRINEQVSDPFQHRRGLRQGDPLSPYLFILAVDVLQRMTTNVSLASPYILSPKVPYPILNFQYADDTVMIASAKGQTLHLLMIAIHCFSAASGLTVNFQKSAFVPISISQDLLPAIESLLGCQQKSLPIVYLGLPLTLKKPSRMDYDKLLLKLEDRLQG